MPIRVALADDSVFVLEGMQQLLAAHESIEVVAACDDMPSLLRAVEVHQPDVVVSDIRMPPSNTDEGIQLAVRLRQLNPEIGVVILSQYAEPRYVLKLLETGSEQSGIGQRRQGRARIAPAVRAALGLAPTARNSKPSVERFSSHETNTVAAMASRNPRCSRYWLPKISGYAALGSTIGRYRRVRPRTLEQVRVEQVAQEIEGDVVEHDGHDDLVGAGPGFEHADDAAPDGAADDAGHQDQQQVQPQRQVQREADPRGEDAGHDDLALRTDVEQARAEGQGDAEAGGDQRGGDGQRLHEGANCPATPFPRGLKTAPWKRAT